MAVTETRQLVNPTLEGSLTAFLKKLDPLGGQAINTASYAPQVAARNTLQTGAETAAAGLGALTGTGAGAADQAGSIASYMSPYQQQVIDASLAEFDRNAAIQQAGLRDAAISRGAYGGGFIPMGSKERADDVPARVSKNEFVMTADAVRAAGGGSVNEGAKKMYELMNNLEARA